jgi:hypothetical protein
MPTAGVLTTYMYSDVRLRIYNQFGELLFEDSNLHFTSETPGYNCEVVALDTKNYPYILEIEVEE